MQKQLVEVRVALENFIESGKTEDDAALESGLSKGTIRKIRAGASFEAFRPTILKRAIQFFTKGNSQEDEVVANYIERELSCTTEEVNLLRRGLHKNYFLFRLSSRSGSLIVSHLRTDKANEKYISFLEKIRLQSAPFSPEPFEDYFHSGFVFLRRENLYFWNVASSNLRTISLRLWGSQRFERAAGGTIGRNVLGDAISQKILLLHAPFSDDEIEQKIGDYKDDEVPKEFVEMKNHLSRLASVEGATLGML